LRPPSKTTRGATRHKECSKQRAAAAWHPPLLHSAARNDSNDSEVRHKLPNHRACLLAAALAAAGLFQFSDGGAARRQPSGRVGTHASVQPPGCACFAPGTDPDYIEHFVGNLAARYVAANRWTSTVTDGGVNGAGVPISLTYSFVPDGTVQTDDGPLDNQLHAVFDAQFGSRAAWQNLFRDALEQWTALVGVRFVLEPSDDRAAWPNSPGQSGVRGDLRVLCAAEDGPAGVLAFAYFPNAGDLKFDSAESWGQAALDHRFFRNVVTHEIGHALGLQHTFPVNESKLMEPLLTLAFDGPQDDDIRGATIFYGDPREQNNSDASAAGLGPFQLGDVYGALALHTSADADWFRFSVSNGQTIGFTAGPIGGEYAVGDSANSTATVDTTAVLPLRVDVFDAAGETLLRSAAAGAGNAATTLAVAAPDGDDSVLVRVSTDGSTNDVQRYEMELTAVDETRSLQIVPSGVSTADIAIDPPDVSGVDTVMTQTTLEFTPGTEVTLTAPAEVDDAVFLNWDIDGVAKSGGQAAVSVTMSADHVALARYDGVLLVDVGEDRAIVVGESVTLEATVTNAVGAVSFVWTPADSLSAANAASVTATPQQTTTYTVRVTDAEGSVAADSVTVQALDPLAADAGPDRAMVRGAPFAITGAASGGEEPYAFAWSPASGAANTATITAVIEEDTDFTLTVTDANGRMATDSVRIDAVPELAVQIDGPTVVAAGRELTLEAAVSGGAAPLTITWQNVGTGEQSSGGTLTTTLSSAATFLVTVRDALGQVADASTGVEVAAALEVEIVVGVSSADGVTLRAVTSGGAAPFEYAWSPADSLNAADRAEVVAHPAESTRYTLVVTDAAGQTAEAATTVDPPSVVAGETAGGDNPTPAPMPGLCGFGLATAAPFMLASCLLGTRRRRRLAR